MKLTELLCLRRILNSSYHPFRVSPKPSIWPRRERLMRMMAWQYGASYLTVKHGYRKLNKVLIYMNMHRKDEPLLEKYYGEVRLKSALSEYKTENRDFVDMMEKAHILLDKQIFSQLAIYEPRTFKCLVELAQKMSLREVRQVHQSQEELDHVQIDTSLFGEPYPAPVKYPMGPVEDHRNVPRRLRKDEF